MGSGRVERAKGRAAGAAAARKAGKAKEYSSHDICTAPFPSNYQTARLLRGAVRSIEWLESTVVVSCHAPTGGRTAAWHKCSVAGIVRALCRDEARAEATGRRSEGDLANTSRFNIPGYLQYPRFEKTRRKPVFLYATAS
jgi:hypothetical protein